jgi:hypothetical protein
MLELNEKTKAKLRPGGRNPWRQLIKDFREKQVAIRANEPNPWRDIIKEFRMNRAAKKMEEGNFGKGLLADGKDRQVAEGETGIGGLENDAMLEANKTGGLRGDDGRNSILKDVEELDEKESEKSDQQDIKSTFKSSVSSKEIVTSKPPKEEPFVISGLIGAEEIFRRPSRMILTPQTAKASSMPSETTLDFLDAANKFTEMVRARAQAQGSPVGSAPNKRSNKSPPKRAKTQQNHPKPAKARRFTLDDATTTTRPADKLYTNPPMSGNPWDGVIAGLKPPGAPDSPPSNPWDNVIKGLCLEVPPLNRTAKDPRRR